MSVGTLGAYRLKVRVGDSEFEAEGPEETVKSQFEMFLAALGQSPKPGQNGKPKKPTAVGGDPADDLMSDGTWSRFFKLEGDADVSLKVLPTTENQNADALILILYGYLVLRKVDTVSSTDLLAMGKKSGLRIDRIDRSVPPAYNRYMSKGGSRKGTRYSLNNQGQAYAQNLLETEAER